MLFDISDLTYDGNPNSPERDLPILHNKLYTTDIRYEFGFRSDMIEIVIRELLVQRIVEKEELEFDLVLRLYSGKSWVLIDH